VRTPDIFEHNGKQTGIFAHPFSQLVNRQPETSAWSGLFAFIPVLRRDQIRPSDLKRR